MSRKRRAFICLTVSAVLLDCGARTSLYAPPTRQNDNTDAMSPDGDKHPNGIAIAVGPYTACALLVGGAVKCWGARWGGALGDGQILGSETCDSAPCSTTPVAVSGVSGAIAVTPTCTLFPDGTARCWGDNSAGELGMGSTSGPEQCPNRQVMSHPCSTTPVAVSGLVGANAIASGGAHTCALLDGGTVECWGDDVSTPMPVAGLTGVTALAAGGSYTCALLGSGTVECWGDNSLGQLGNGSNTSSTAPLIVPGLTGMTAIAAGLGHACALRFDGTVECWGDNQAGQLGNGQTGPETCAMSPCSLTPVVVQSLAGATAIAAGDLDTCALLSDSTVVCWGDNISGELGDGMRTGPQTCTNSVMCSKKPVAVLGLTGVTAIAVGGASACAVISGTTVECWGDNTFGELGDGTSQGPEGCSLACSTRPVGVWGL